MKTDGDLGNPNIYVPLDTRTVDRNVRLLEDCFGTKRDERWFSEDTFCGVLLLLGLEACARERSRRGVLGPGNHHLPLGCGNAPQ